MSDEAVITVRLAAAADADAWDAFVDGHDQATLFHRFGWSRVIEKTFGHSPRYLMAERGGALVGILPLIHKTSRLFGNALISNAFCSYGGVVAVDSETTGTLEDRAVEIARQLDVDYLELRNLEPRNDTWLRNDSTYATFRKAIEPGQDEIIKAIPKSMRRRSVRKSLREGLEFEVRDDIDEFYDVMAQSFRNLGTPIFPKRYFRNLQDEFGSSLDICLVRGPDGPLATAMAFYFKDDVHPFYVGGTVAARRVHANDLLYLKIMCRALERGYGTFDFGRSKSGTGAFEYKTYWGFTPHPLCYEYQLIKAREMPNLNPLNPKYHLMVEAWKRLPLPVSKIIGPMIIGQIG